jgi:hypothetical protein
MQSKLLLSLAAILLLVVSSCATKVNFPVSKVAPRADVSAKVKGDANGNFKIDLKVENLTSPDRLNPPKEMYVVWIETARGTKNLGQLNMSSGMFSATRKGSLSTTSAFEPKRILITAENVSTNNQPSTQVIIESEIFNQD